MKKSSLTSLGRAINHSAADRSNLLREHLLGEAVDESANYRISEGETKTDLTRISRSNVSSNT